MGEAIWGSSGGGGESLNKKELNSLANFQTTLGNVTSLNAQASSSELQSKAARRDIEILDQSVPLKQGLFDLQMQSTLLNREKQLSDIGRQALEQRRRLFVRQPAGLLQLDDIISEAERKASFVNKEVGIMNNRLMFEKGLQTQQFLQQALALEDRARLADISASSARSRARSTLLAGELRRSASESLR